MSSTLNDSLDLTGIENRLDEDEDDEEFYDSEVEPSVLLDTSLNISVDDNSIMNQTFQNQSFQQQEQIFYAVQFIDKTKVDQEGI